MRNLFLIILFFYSPLLFASIGNDYLLNKDKTSPEVKLQYYYQQYQKYKISNPDSAHYFVDRLLTVARGTKDKVWLGKAYRSRGRILKEQGFLGDAVQAHFDAIEQFKAANEPLHVADNFSYIGIIYMESGDASALSYLNTALQLYKDFGDESEQALAHYNLGKHYTKMEKYQLAFSHFQKCSDLATKASDFDKLINAFNYFGIVSFKDKQYEKAKEYYKKSMALADSTSDSLKYKIMGFINIGEAYIYQDSLREAETWLNKALSLEKNLQSHDPLLSHSRLNLMGELYRKLQKKQKALSYLEAGLKDVDLNIINEETSIGLTRIIEVLAIEKDKEDYEKLLRYSQELSKYFKKVAAEKEKLEQLNKQYVIRFATEKHQLNAKIHDSEEKRELSRVAILIGTVCFAMVGVVVFFALKKLAIQSWRLRMARKAANE